MFKEIHPIELEIGELRILDAAAGADWTKVRPSIFGNIFEGAFQSDEGKKKRHAHGIHFTSEGDIKRIVLPTIVDYWGDRIAAAHSLDELQVLHRELNEYKILDPACGSGNFLYVAYQDLKAVEFDLLQRLQLLDPSRSYQSLVTPQQFFGMDINSFAVELAKVTLMIGRAVAIRKLDLPENSLPLDTLDKNIVCADALFTDWVKADAIIGNPPFLGGSRIRKELTDDYAERVFAKFGEIHAQVDFASYWFRLAHECLERNGRAGLVATNSISQGKSRAVSLDYIVQNDGYIYDAGGSIRRLENAENSLWDGDVESTIALFQGLKFKRAVNFVGYLRKHRQRIPEYGYLHQLKITIGSGSVESSIKQIGRRIKISGAQWKKENIAQVLKHRCAYLNGFLDSPKYNYSVPN